MWNGMNMPDNRVLQYWDDDHVIGQWFAREIDGYEGIAWDAYYLYGPEAIWENIPLPLVSSGGTIYGERQTLKMQVSTLVDGLR
jgi:hypothetical protein